MGITAFSGPQLVFGLTQTSTGGTTDYNGERGPSLFDLGTAVYDPRYQFCYGPGNAPGSKIYGFARGEAMVDYVPITAQTSAFAVSSATTPTAGTAITLAAASTTVGTYATTVVDPDTGLTSGSLLAIDS